MSDIKGQNGSDQEVKVSALIMNKLLGAYKTAKESPYVKTLYQETASAFNINNDSSSKAIKDTVLPENTSITLYPNYCQYVDGIYISKLKGVVTFNGSLSRKNRFLLSMARRLCKSNESNDIDSSEFVHQIEDAITNQESAEAKPTSQDEYDPSIASNTDDTIKERMEGILAKVIAGTPLDIIIGSEQPVDELSSVKLHTDNFGMFQTTITTNYKPSYIVVSSSINTSVLQTAAIEVVDTKGVSVITDIDDTIRITGVLGDKREMFRNIFSKPFSACEISGVSEWYQILRDDFNCPVHYVSNSPWQVFNIVHDFMEYQNFPVTSVHLRQYSGNIVASFTQPSAERKRPSLVHLLEEFPKRKFILVGDTGEQDLEAYLSLIPNFSPQILAIYMRVVPTSLSISGNDSLVLGEIRNIIEKRNTSNSKDVHQFFKNPTGVDSDGSDPEDCRNSAGNTTTYDFTRSKTRRRSSISLEAAKNTFNTAVRISGVKKLPPIVPNKPASLRGTPLNTTVPSNPRVSKVRKLSLPARSETFASNGNVVLEPTADAPLDAVDKRRAMWRVKAQRIVDEVPEHIDVKFWESPGDVREACIELISKELD